MITSIDIKLELGTNYPTRAHPTDAGIDLASNDFYSIKLGDRSLIKTGVRVRIPEGYVGLLAARSSLQKKGLVLGNSLGIIDSDYRGEILVSLVNVFGLEYARIDKSERIAQLLVVPIALPNLNIVHESEELWNSTIRGNGGFGSTG